MTVGEANRYAEDAVARFLEAGRIALRAGANESALVTMRPALTSRASMSSGLSSELLCNVVREPTTWRCSANMIL
ncbi:Non-specific phospholipase C1 [Zea mays]|uniref:Non-specific phospholipase C1 n=1 Tax=Zea mays TaxID=4577 RepID=A0A1D6LAA6_MAIZE|nr:Non-specific phospholipase C1 [Zea mays]